ncbi:hypothetical protein HPB48_025880 [Haemaphysalis longicornis]|uniref:Uncharacterized protein n=1 Tax=Haemaphysalis longicornis TaxID=44386 RepID=A0A9J6H9F9_HAELO|nr:hypothetical protein HPB48_025880 [Haemaphysalis longicornis]
MGGGGTLPGVFSSSEYRAWMRRAPSTSALYERVGRLSSAGSATGLARVAAGGGGGGSLLHHQQQQHPQMSSSSGTSSLRRPLPRVAHSAESLLDSLRQVGTQLS